MGMTRFQTETTSEAQRISLAGSVLVASPDVGIAGMEESVVLVLEHTKSHAVGILLNRTIDFDSSSIWNFLLGDADGVDLESVEERTHINFGGPQGGPLLAIHDNKELADGGNNLGVYLAAQTESIKQLVTLPSQTCRLFVGCASWGPNELEQQIIDGRWHVMAAIPQLVFDEEPRMWHRAVRAIGNEVIFRATGLLVPPGTAETN
jgi:putative transcriptional regulator